jgi:polar amino acid transport system ATP-binding protein
MMRATDVTKTYPGAAKAVLISVSMVAEPGQIVALVGKSGAGKSTLLRCLCGLTSFDSGSIEVTGAIVKGGTDPSPLLGRVGMVFQSLELFPHLTVVENLTLAPIHVRSAAPSDARTRASALLTSLEIGDKGDAYPAALSGGQRQRVAIARALMMEPAVLLYDEPTSALDPELKLEVHKTLLRVKDQTPTAQIVVTHDDKLADEVATHVYVLEAGALRPRAK